MLPHAARRFRQRRLSLQGKRREIGSSHDHGLRGRRGHDSDRPAGRERRKRSHLPAGSGRPPHHGVTASGYSCRGRTRRGSPCKTSTSRSRGPAQGLRAPSIGRVRSGAFRSFPQKTPFGAKTASGALVYFAARPAGAAARGPFEPRRRRTARREEEEKLEAVRPNRAEFDLAALRHNLRALAPAGGPRCGRSSPPSRRTPTDTGRRRSPVRSRTDGRYLRPRDRQLRGRPPPFAMPASICRC